MLRVINPRLAGNNHVVGIGDDLSVATLVWAYRRGIFPWPTPASPILWFCPPERAVLDFTRLHIPRRLSRQRRHGDMTFTVDRDFPAVIAACRGAPRPRQDGTWITAPLLNAYVALHQAGHAHSVEAWDSEGQLVGGLYGVSVDGNFAGESMFHRAPNASKLALLHLAEHLQARGLDWLDIQMMTPHMAALGATPLSRNVFLDRLAATGARGTVLFP
jgi:leucyl/phenylalanyl-tRNA--protein transferase